MELRYVTDKFPAWWFKFEGLPWMVNLEGKSHELLHHRWLLVMLEKEVCIYDAATRSLQPVAVLEKYSSCWKSEPAHHCCLGITRRGEGVLIAQRKVYRFTALSYVQSLEILAAAVTWKQLTKAHRDVIDKQGPYEFETFSRTCLAECEPPLVSISKKTKR